MSKSRRIEIVPVPLESILPLRDEYRRLMNCQIVHDSWHRRGFTQSYLVKIDDETAGYGAVGGPPSEARDIAKEFYLRPRFREFALPLFRQFVEVSGAKRIESQTNDVQMALLFVDCATEWASETILFSDQLSTNLPPPTGVTFRALSEPDRATVFEHKMEPVGNWGLELDGEIVATGGLLFHYNPPYGDIFMEVAEPYRRRGFASYLIQEVKRECYSEGHLPGARCFHTNIGSRAALQRAGMLPCGRILKGGLRSAD
jgi:GNAT superfamily N-acetyltransferase